MVLHADHHYGSAIGQKPSLMSSVSATTWDSTNDRSLSTKSTKSTKTRKSAAQGSGARKSPFKTSRAEAQREREKSVRVFRYGTPPKNIYAKNDGERVTQREWDTLNDTVRRQLREVAYQEREEQVMATARLSVPGRSFAPVNPLKERPEDFEALVSITEESDYRMWNKNEGWERLRATRGPTGNCSGCHGVITRVRKPLFTPEMMEKIINKAKKQKSTGGLLAMGRGEDTDKLVEQELKQMDSMLGRSTIGQRLAREKLASKVEEERRVLLEKECERRSQPYIAVTELYLPGNNLGRCGAFPSFSVSLLSQLVTLVMSDNHFSARLEDVMMMPMPTLEVLDLTGNRFSGPLPTALGGFRNLASIKLGRNRLSGPIPGAWGKLERLDFIDLHNNKVTGEVLPRELIEGAKNFREIRAGGNLLDRFEVPMPCKLRRVDLFNNKLSGEISDTVRWAPLTHLNLVQNALVGDIPISSLSQLPLVEVYLNHNNFSDPKVQGARLQANLPNCRISVDDYGFSGSPSRGAAVPLYDRVSVDDYSAPGGSPDPRPDSPG